MYKNYIFDFGNVLVRFDPDYIAGGEGLSDEDRALIVGVVFDRLYWDRLDDGKMTDGECVSLFLKRLPERLHEKAKRIFYGWAHRLPPIPGAEELIKELKERGAKLFLLSDISRSFAENHGFIPVISYFDGEVYSGITRLSKNFTSAFEYTINKYRLIPAETLFIDDKKSNILNAEKTGLNTYLFDGDIKKLRGFILSK